LVVPAALSGWPARMGRPSSIGHDRGRARRSAQFRIRRFRRSAASARRIGICRSAGDYLRGCRIRAAAAAARVLPAAAAARVCCFAAATAAWRAFLLANAACGSRSGLRTPASDRCGASGLGGAQPNARRIAAGRIAWRRFRATRHSWFASRRGWCACGGGPQSPRRSAAFVAVIDGGGKTRATAACRRSGYCSSARNDQAGNSATTAAAPGDTGRRNDQAGGSAATAASGDSGCRNDQAGGSAATAASRNSGSGDRQACATAIAPSGSGPSRDQASAPTATPTATSSARSGDREACSAPTATAAATACCSAGARGGQTAAATSGRQIRLSSGQDAGRGGRPPDLQIKQIRNASFRRKRLRHPFIATDDGALRPRCLLPSFSSWMPAMEGDYGGT
jgi:hypothetical protein